MAARRSWLKNGCFGCLGVSALVLVGVAVVAALSVGSSRPEQVEDRVLTHEISAEAAGDASIGRVIFDIHEAELHLERAEPGEPIRVEARYDVNAFALEETFDPGTANDGAWSYRVTFGKGDRPGMFSGLVSMARGSTARVDVFLPADARIDLTLKSDKGAATVRLGGLWLRNADVEFSAGAFDLSVDEPLHEPMETLSIRSAMGGALLNRLGNASPRRLDVSYSTGGIDMDLGGRWMRDAEIRIDRGLGGGAVHLPGGVIIEGLDREPVEPPADTELEMPVLKFSVSGGLGRLEFSG